MADDDPGILFTHPDRNLEPFARAILKQNAAELRKLIARNPY